MSHVSPLTPRSPLLDLIARAEADPDSDEAHFLSQLRAAISGLETRPTAYVSRPRSPRPDLKIVRTAG